MSSETFFKGKIYFQTSFKIPDEITFEILYLSLLGAASTNFRVLYYTMNKDHTGYEENTRLPLFYEDISGDSLESVHQQVIANINEDNLYLFQFYKATLTNGERYLVINAHHGIADGQMITNLMLYLYDAVFGTNYNDKLIRDFVPYDALMDLKNITFPSTWTVQKDMIREKPQFTSEDSDVDICIKKKEPETVSSESSYTINLQKTIPADVMTRCFSLLKQYDSSLPSYKHGLLLYLGMKALYGLQYKEKSEMKPEDRIGLSSVVNMRRYLNENATNPSLCIDSLHFDSSILDLCERTTSPESLQKMSNKKLAEGIPLFSSLKENQKIDSSLSMHSHNVKDSQLYFEYSFLGNHPEHCFQRTKITQSILNSEFHLNSISCVVWINRDNSAELCMCGNSSEISKEDLQSVLDAVAYQFYDYSAI